MTYDPSNIFARLVRGEIPCDKIYEDAYALAFHDIHPQATVHALVIPKGPYVNHGDFVARANDSELVGFFRAVAMTAEKLGLTEAGYRLISNTGKNGGQEVPHYHVHILGGSPLGRMVGK